MISIHICQIHDLGYDPMDEVAIWLLWQEQEAERRAHEKGLDESYICPNCGDTGWKPCPGHEIDPDGHVEIACPWVCVDAEVPCSTCERGNGEAPPNIDEDYRGEEPFDLVDALNQA